MNREYSSVKISIDDLFVMSKLQVSRVSLLVYVGDERYVNNGILVKAIPRVGNKMLMPVLDIQDILGYQETVVPHGAKGIITLDNDTELDSMISSFKMPAKIEDNGALFKRMFVKITNDELITIFKRVIVARLKGSITKAPQIFDFWPLWDMFCESLSNTKYMWINTPTMSMELLLPTLVTKGTGKQDRIVLYFREEIDHITNTKVSIDLLTEADHYTLLKMKMIVDRPIMTMPVEVNLNDRCLLTPFESLRIEDKQYRNRLTITESLYPNIRVVYNIVPKLLPRTEDEILGLKEIVDPIALSNVHTS